MSVCRCLRCEQFYLSRCAARHGCPDCHRDGLRGPNRFFRGNTTPRVSKGEPRSAVPPHLRLVTKIRLRLRASPTTT
jgi:hypothetical protein